MRRVLLSLLCCCLSSSACALDIASLKVYFAQSKEQRRVLDILVGIGMIEKGNWKEAEKVIYRTSGDLGRRSYDLKVPKRGDVQGLSFVAMRPNDERDGPNLPVIAVIVTTKDEVFSYRFKSGKGYVEEK